MTINVKDFDRIAAEIRRTKHQDNYDHMIQKWTGPGTGLVWDEDTNTVSIASDWYADANGDVVRK